MQGKAEDAGGLSPVKDDNAALRFPFRRSSYYYFLTLLSNMYCTPAVYLAGGT